MIILEKARKKKELLEDIVDIIVPAKVIQVSSFINLAKKYK